MQTTYKSGGSTSSWSRDAGDGLQPYRIHKGQVVVSSVWDGLQTYGKISPGLVIHCLSVIIFFIISACKKYEGKKTMVIKILQHIQNCGVSTKIEKMGTFSKYFLKISKYRPIYAYFFNFTTCTELRCE